MPGVISLELNELNLQLMERYTRDLGLDHLGRLLEGSRRWVTTAEPVYEHLEPWIQWVTAHTGLPYEEHQVFRLGDMRDQPVEQIWEAAERCSGVRVGAISPMNARNRANRPAFFVPDPWSDDRVSGSWDLRLLHEGAREAVNENAHGGGSLTAYVKLAAAAAVNADRSRIASYAALANRSRRRGYLRAVFLDHLLCDTFLRQWRRTRPGYATLFLNAGAHIQHHFMYNSCYYDGPHRNPAWYVSPSDDPLGELYRHYDVIVGKVLALADEQDVRLLVCTGLGQVPNEQLVFYYRPLDHEDLLRRLGVAGVTSVEPRMSRDFLVGFADAQAAARGQDLLQAVVSSGGDPYFSVDNRGTSLFVMVAHTSELPREAVAVLGDRLITGFGALFTHVSIENAVHSTRGGFFDCGLPPTVQVETMELPEVFDYTLSVIAQVEAAAAARTVGGEEATGSRP